MHGILVDIIDEAIQTRLGIQLRHEGYPWARAQALVEGGVADAFITVPTEKRSAYTEVGQEPILQFKLFIATTKDNPNLEQLKKVTTIEELKPFRLVDYHGNGFAQKKLQGFNVEWVPEIPAVYPFLAAGKADVMLTSERGIADMEKLGYQDEIIVLPQPLYNLSFHLCVGKKSTYKSILPKVDEALRGMKVDGTSQKLTNRYSDL